MKTKRQSRRIRKYEQNTSEEEDKIGRMKREKNRRARKEI
jgi:hypothetical protein